MAGQILNVGGNVKVHAASLRRAVAYYALTEGVQLIMMTAGSGHLTMELLRRIILRLQLCTPPSSMRFSRRAMWKL